MRLVGRGRCGRRSSGSIGGIAKDGRDDGVFEIGGVGGAIGEVRRGVVCSENGFGLGREEGVGWSVGWWCVFGIWQYGGYVGSDKLRS